MNLWGWEKNTYKWWRLVQPTWYTTLLCAKIWWRFFASPQNKWQVFGLMFFVWNVDFQTERIHHFVGVALGFTYESHRTLLKSRSLSSYSLTSHPFKSFNIRNWHQMFLYSQYSGIDSSKNDALSVRNEKAKPFGCESVKPSDEQSPPTVCVFSHMLVHVPLELWGCVIFVWHPNIAPPPSITTTTTTTHVFSVSCSPGSSCSRNMEAWDPKGSTWPPTGQWWVVWSSIKSLPIVWNLVLVSPTFHVLMVYLLDLYGKM